MRKIPVLLVTLQILAFTTVSAQVLSSEKSAEIDRYIEQEMSKRRIPGMALGIYHRGRVIKTGAYGLADVQNRGPVRVETVFELASITKQFTASSIMIMVQEGILSVDDEISKYLEDAPDNWKGVRIRHLMSHTSGLPVIGKGFSGYRDLTIEQLKQLTSLNIPADVAYAQAKKDTLTFTPGEKYTYSDVGYFLLGLIIEQASGMSYRDFLQKKIFDPVGMYDTYLVDQRKIHPFEARGYTIRDGELVNIRRVRDYEVPSHYGVFSTIGDLAKWDSILYTDQILTRASKELMWRPTTLNSGKKFPYGFGWNTWVNGGKKVIDHTGITGTQMTRILSDSLTVIVLTNLGTGAGGAADSWGIGPRVAEIMGYSPFVQDNHMVGDVGVAEKFNPARLRRLEGTYHRVGGSAPRKLYMENGQLLYQRGDNVNRLIPLEDGRLLVLGTLHEWVIEVQEAGKGKQPALKWYWNGAPNVVMERIKDPEESR